MSTTGMRLNHLELAEPLRLSMGRNNTEVFLDAPNRQMIQLTDRELIRFPLDDDKRSMVQRYQFPSWTPNIVAIGFSHDQYILSVLRSDQLMEFIDTYDAKRVTVNSKKGSKYLGFFWTHGDSVVLVSDNGLEYMQYTAEKKFRLIKEVKLSRIRWFTYSPTTRCVLCCVGDGTLHGFYFRVNQISKIPKFDLDLPTPRRPIARDDVVITQLYERLFCLHINAERHCIHVYSLTLEVVSLNRRIDLVVPGRCGLGVVDNLLLVHSYDGQISMIFDVRDADSRYPVVAPLPLAPVEGQYLPAQMYTPEWQFYMPNYMFDRANGLVWHVVVNLDEILLGFQSRDRMVEFLMRRHRSRPLVLQVIRDAVFERESLEVIKGIFDLINDQLKKALSTEPRAPTTPGGPSLPASGSTSAVSTLRGDVSQLARRVDSESSLAPLAASGRPSSLEAARSKTSPESSSSSSAILLGAQAAPVSTSASIGSSNVIDQHELYAGVFCQAREEDSRVEWRWLVAVLLEYMRSLVARQIACEDYLASLLIETLVHNRQYYQLHQLLQYHVVSESIHVACQLLSLEEVYPPATQLALDMLKRQRCTSQVLEVLLARGQMVAALKLVKQNKDLAFQPERFLQAAYAKGDKMVFFHVYRFFENRRELGGLGQYTQLYSEWFTGRHACVPDDQEDDEDAVYA